MDDRKFVLYVLPRTLEAPSEHTLHVNHPRGSLADPQRSEWTHIETVDGWKVSCPGCSLSNTTIYLACVLCGRSISAFGGQTARVCPRSR